MRCNLTILYLGQLTVSPLLSSVKHFARTVYDTNSIVACEFVAKGTSITRHLLETAAARITENTVLL
jgi:hypothetical protein